MKTATPLAQLAPRTLAGTALLPLALVACAPIEDNGPDPEVLRLSEHLSQCEARLADAAKPQTQEMEAALLALREEMAALGEKVENCTAAPEPVVIVAAEEAEDAGAAVTEEPQKLVVGRLEKVWVEDLQIALPARIDTGAETASLDARNITPFERDGKAWVRFDIKKPKSKEMLTLERRMVREALVVQSNSEEPERRPVIRLGIQLGPVRQLAEFTLSDRSHLDHQMLVGRNILRDVMLVDVSAANLVPLPEVEKKSE